MDAGNGFEERDLKIFLHNQSEAQKLFRNILTGVAVFGVSLGGAVITNWGRVQDLTEGIGDVGSSYGVSEGFVSLTNDIHILFGAMAICIGFIFILDSARLAFEVIDTRVPGFSEGSEESGLSELIRYQYDCFEVSFHLARMAIYLVLIGAVLILFSLLGRADILAVVDGGFVILSILWVLKQTPDFLTNLVKIVVQRLNTADADSYSGVNSQKRAVPHIITIMLVACSWYIAVFVGGLISFVWLLVTRDVFRNLLPDVPISDVGLIVLAVILSLIIISWISRTTYRRMKDDGLISELRAGLYATRLGGKLRETTERVSSPFQRE